ncbi:MAG: DUF2062 domain-containing protein [Deltaproteobacteria bacterium]|nr:DUF2062 domain-containing protein [Deltaproteobacteria bacterium]
MIRALHKRVHQLWLHLLHEHTEPSRMAAAVFLGCVVGCTPLFGLHLWVCVALAWLFRLNQIVVYAAANISIPPLAPFIGFAAVQLGERLLHGRWMALELAEFTWQNAPSLAAAFFVDWLVGGTLLGAAVGLVAGALTWGALSARRARRRLQDDPAHAAIVAASARYRGLRNQFRVYAHMKYRMDPCYRAIAALVPPGAFTVDLGTGLGMLPVLLGQLGAGRRALGVEWDAPKAEAARRVASELPGVDIVEADVREFEPPACDVISLVDVLHYYDAPAQRTLLARCRAALGPGGRLLIREGDRDRRGGARLTRFIERASTRLGWNRGPSVQFRAGADLRVDLESLGFSVRTAEVAGTLHPGNLLLIADLPPAEQPAGEQGPAQSSDSANGAPTPPLAATPV